MKTSTTIIGIAISLALGSLIILAGSQGSVTYQGLALFALCGSIGFILHWLVFIPSYTFQTEHYFDLTGSISYIATVSAAIYLNPQLNIRDMIICAMIVIWALRLGSFLFGRIKKDGKDKRFTVMKTKFTWFLMTWTLGGLWVLVTMAAGLAAITSDTAVPLGGLAYTGIFLWVAGMVIEVMADTQKTNFRKIPENRDRFITSGIWAWSRHPNYFGEIIEWLGWAILTWSISGAVFALWTIANLFPRAFAHHQWYKEKFPDYPKNRKAIIPGII
jgi:steroid 5-alpha reductase family enzyme